MFPNRGPEAERNTLPPISSLSSHDAERRPSSSLDHHRSPPAGLLPRPQREMEAMRGPFPRPGDDAYGAPNSSKFSHNGPPPPPFHRDPERGSPVSEEGGWRSFERPDARFPAKDNYSPHMPTAPFAPRDDARPSAWPRSAEESHRPRLPGPPTSMREEGPWRSASTSRDRADMHPEAFAHDRAREDERWRDERAGRPMHPYDAPPGYPDMGPYPQDPRGAARPLDADYIEDGRRIRRRATSSLVEDEQNVHRYPPPGARPYASGTYSPPEPRSQSAAPHQPPMRPGMMAGMEPPRPASTLGVMGQSGMPNGPGAPPTGATAAPAATNTVNANRRVAHLLSEQKRRESINTGFEDLRQAIPACRDGQDSKATILKRALEYIRELETVVERQHRPPFESHALGGYSNRSPPDDKDDLRRFGRPSAEEERRGSHGGRQMSGSGSSSEAGSGPRIGGLPSNAYGAPANGYQPPQGPYHPRSHAPYGSPNLPLAFNAPHDAVRSAPEHSRPAPALAPINGSNDVRGPATKRWAEDSDEGQRSPSRRRVSDGDKDDVQRSPVESNYMIAHKVHPRSPMLRSPKLDKPRDWHTRMDNKSLVDSAVRV